MPPPLGPGELSFTVQQMIDILERYSPYFPSWTDRWPTEFSPYKLNERRERKTLVLLEGKDVELEAEKLCISILGHDARFEGAIERLDAASSIVLTTNFRLPQASDVVARSACELLCRMPRTVPPLAIDDLRDLENVFPSEAFVPSAPRTWDNLKAVRFLDSNTIRLALHISGYKGSSSYSSMYRKLADVYGDLFKASMALPVNTAPDQQQQPMVHTSYDANIFLQLARIFFWCAWNRCIMLTLWNVLQYHLIIGYDHRRNRSLVLKHTSLLRNIMSRSSMPEQTTPVQSDAISNTEYMCRWAFQLLQFDLGSVSLDFRYFHERYHQAFGQRRPRCKLLPEDLGSTAQCSGDSPFTCNRFQGIKIEDQSAHATYCPGACTKLVWSEESYRSLSGPRAVDVSTTTSKIQYRNATQSTLGISHCWSHGQGGRPEAPKGSGTWPFKTLPGGTGFNECLHKRYCDLAQTFQCDSYWMDTPCIPQDHQLRRESIGYINQIFAESRVVLICDRDLMAIDINPDQGAVVSSGKNLVQADDIPLLVLESLLATLMVCDWNLRAWTFLESMRGRRNLHLLCKNERVVSLYDCICRVHRHGRIDISVLLVNAQHLLPAQPPRPNSSGNVESWHEDRTKGLVDATEASFLLSHRHASRNGDEVVIWSLLCREKPSYTAMEFWSTFRDERFAMLPTSYLMNNLPRIRKPLRCLQKHLGWAPCRPNFPREWDSSNTRYFVVPDSEQCRYGYVSKKGFNATWLVMTFKCQWPCRWLRSTRSQDVMEPFICDIVNRFLRGYNVGAIVQPCDEFDQPMSYRGPVGGTLVAVLGQDFRGRWHWRGVIDWPSTIDLPTMTAKELVIV